MAVRKVSVGPEQSWLERRIAVRTTVDQLDSVCEAARVPGQTMLDLVMRWTCAKAYRAALQAARMGRAATSSNQEPGPDTAPMEPSQRI